MDSVHVLLFLVSLTCLHVSLANRFYISRSFLRQRGHRFYDENEYDDGYAEYTGAEKRTLYEMQRRRFQDVREDEAEEKRDNIDDLLFRELSRGEYTATGAEKRTLYEMQRRRFQDVREDEAEEKRDNIDDLLFRELSRGEYTATDTRDEEYPYKVETNDRRYSDSDDDRSFNILPDRTYHSDELKDQIEDGAGTAQDDLALKREEEKQKKMARMKNLPNDGELFEGDIVMDQRLRSWVTGQYDKRDAINDVSYLWPKSDDGTVEVPYTLSQEILEDTEKLASINKAVESFNKFTCVRYVKRNDDEVDGQDHAHFMINLTMCYSSVGRQGGKQDISIGNGCERLGTVIHEMMHTIGFIHEQSRPDRDKYVRVFFDNIKAGMQHNFEKYTTGQVETLSVNKGFYDYDSCLHYNNHAFSKNSGDTIESISDPTRRFGQRETFSEHDILQINELYNCEVADLHDKMQDIPYE